jgi:DNA-directed RNA polymerase specialized sigma subunit
LIDILPEQQPTIFGIVIEQDLQQRVQIAIQNLPVNLRQIITWRYSDPKLWELKPDGNLVERERPDPDAKIPTLRYVASIKGVTYQAITQQEERALKKLRLELLKTETDTPESYAAAAKEGRNSSKRH